MFLLLILNKLMLVGILSDAGIIPMKYQIESENGDFSNLAFLLFLNITCEASRLC